MHKKRLVTKRIRLLNKIIIKYLLSFLLVFLILNSNFLIKTISADPSNYYVSPTGNNSNTGLTPGNAWLTIEYAITQVNSGDTLYIMAGVYTPVSGQIIISNKNSPGLWLTIRNYENDNVIIDGTNCPTANYINAVIELKNCAYIRISGITINHSARGGITLMTRPCSFVTIDNCCITNCSCFAIKTAWGMNNVTIERNYIYNNFNNWSALQPPLYVSQETISLENLTTFNINNNTLINNRHLNINIKGGGRNGKICYNEINTTAGYVNIIGYNIYGGSGIYIDARGKTHNISVYNNNIYGNNTGIILNTEAGGHFEYLYIFNNIVNMTNDNNKPINNLYAGRGPFGLFNTGFSTDLFHHIYIYSNIFRTGIYNIYSVFQVGHSSQNQFNSNNLKNVYIINNIFCSVTTSNIDMAQINKISYEEGSFFVNNNAYYRTAGTLRITWNGTSYYTSSPTYWGNNPIFTNPMFINNVNQGGDFHLQTTSPCIDIGDDTIVPSFDFDRVSRPQGSGYDIGAYEFVSEFDTNPPQISEISIVTSNPLDTNPSFGWVNVSCTVTDNIATSQVVLRIQSPGDFWNNISMISRTSDKYYYRTTTAFSNVGNYTYSIWAKDTSNNIVISSNILFSMPPNWDININGGCTILDLVLVSNLYGSTGNPGWIREDVDNNGEITVLDLNIVSNYFGVSWYD